MSERPYQRPAGPPPFHQYAQDWGGWLFSASRLDFNSDAGLALLLGVERVAYGFRKHPYASRVLVRGGASTAGRVAFELEAHLRDVRRSVDAGVNVIVSGIGKHRFFGRGNETANGPDRVHRVRRYDFRVEPRLTARSGSDLRVGFGPVLKLYRTSRDPGRVIDSLLPYGSGAFGLAGVAADGAWGRSDGAHWPTRGFTFRIGGSAYPALFGATEAFGEFHGSLSAYLPLPLSIGPVLAVRLSGKRTWGRVPYQEAAYLGGRRSLRGFETDRYAGDAALFANAELRVPVTRFGTWLPLEVGVVSLVDVGRVFVEGELSSTWHASAGGGVWIAPFDRDYTVSAVLARGEETKIRVYLGLAY